ncbi:MFS transporter [Candidatus Bathyarchaeota archaeon]|nr:MFS transporter [Candidatus Bathyarchaeota archaeon]
MIISSLLKPCRIAVKNYVSQRHFKGFATIYLVGFTQTFIATFNYTMMIIWLGSSNEGLCPALSIGRAIYYAWLLLISYDVAELIFKPILSFLSDKFGWRMALILSIISQVISLAALIGNELQNFLISRVLQGIASSISPTLMAVVSNLTDGGERYVGVYMGFRGLGYLAAPLLIAIMEGLSKQSIIFIMFSLAFLQTAPLIINVHLKFRKADTLNLNTLFQKNICLLFLLTVLASILMGVRFTLIPLVMIRRGFTTQIVSMILTLGFLICIIGQSSSGILLENRHLMLVASLGFILSTVGSAYMPLTRNLLDLLIVALTVTLGSGLTLLSTNTLLTRKARRTNITSTLGLNGLAQSMGELIGLTAIASLSEIDLNMAIVSIIVVTLTGFIASLLIREEPWR